MNIILLSGGSGKRLWPLSNDIRSKQFIKIFKKKDAVGISLEPCRRDTFDAIALATAYLHDVKCIPEDEAVVVCPVDPYVELGYFECVNELYKAAGTGNQNLVLMVLLSQYKILSSCLYDLYG